MSSFYYDDLSAGSNSDHDRYMLSSDESGYSDDDDEEEVVEGNETTSSQKSNHKYTTLENGLWDRCILHLDVDCFYCQCEEIDRGLRQNNDSSTCPPRPLAIGQKHIIVTSNYEARKYGVQKLQTRESAYLACPHLWIVEGSDLLHYRRHSRAIYNAFRKSLTQISMELNGDEDVNVNVDDVDVDANDGNQKKTILPAKKGCMDEMMVDLTMAVDRILQRYETSKSVLASISGQTLVSDQDRFVFGNDTPSSMAVLVEDQTGQKSVISYQPSSSSSSLSLSTFAGRGSSGSDNSTTTPNNTSLVESRQNVHDICGATDQDRQKCQRRLDIAADLTARICHDIRQQTGFFTTGGISTSPLLAKLASGLHKPKSINVLYPWRTSQLLYSMPLRKMQRIGHGTMKVLEMAISHTQGKDREWTNDNDRDSITPNQSILEGGRKVLDFLQLPRKSIRKALQGLAAFQSDEEQQENQCDLLIQHCRGLDPSEIIDDHGAPPKTVSVENSFRRGTICTLPAVHAALEDLYRRLPLLVQDRTSWSSNPSHAYPTTIRLTARMVDPKLLSSTKKRRPFVTKSKQCRIDGKRYFVSSHPDVHAQADAIRRHIEPLLKQLLPATIHVTRMNIALCNFQDSPGTILGERSSQMTLPILTSFSQQKLGQNNETTSSIPKKKEKCERNSLQAAFSTTITKDIASSRISQSQYQIPLPIRTRKLGVDRQKLSQQRPLSNKKPKLNSTRIDHFFYKK